MDYGRNNVEKVCVYLTTEQNLCHNKEILWKSPNSKLPHKHENGVFCPNFFCYAWAITSTKMMPFPFICWASDDTGNVAVLTTLR